MDATYAEHVSRVADTVRKLRTQAGLSQEAYAERCDLSARYVQMVESGKHEPGIIVLAKLAQGLGIKPSALLRRAGW